jgi:hypothetical protein
MSLDWLFFEKLSCQAAQNYDLQHMVLEKPQNIVISPKYGK